MQKKIVKAIAVGCFLLCSNSLLAATTRINTSVMYTVKPGDTLSNIANSANVSQGDIQMAYQQKSGQLTPGDLLIFDDQFTPSNSVWNKYQSQLSQSSFVYTVQSGDTLSAIANQYNITTNAIVFLYRNNPNFLSPGDELLLPVSTTSNVSRSSSAVSSSATGVRLITNLVYIVEPGDTLNIINNYLHMPAGMLSQLNPNVTDATLEVGQALNIGSVYAQLYTVQSGDTLNGIAQKLNSDPANVAVIDRANPNFISPGDKVLVNIQKWANPISAQSTPSNTSPGSNSVGTQINYVSATLTPTGNDNSGSSAQPLTQQQIVAKYSNQYNVNPNLIFAMIRAESDFNPYALSPANCYGLMQLSLPTARLFDKSVTTQNIYDPETNINIGVKYFKLLMNQFNNNLVCAIAAYNAGSQNVINWLSNDPNLSISDIPFLATRQYVQAVLTFYNQYQQSGIFGGSSN